MIRSMTAFARVKGKAGKGSTKAKNFAGWTVEIRSVNHRFLDLSVKLPLAYSTLENKIRELIQPRIPRGKVSVSISQDGGEEKTRQVTLDESVVKGYLDSIQRLKKKYRLQGSASVTDLLKLPNIFTFDQPEVDAAAAWGNLKKVLEQAIEQALIARKTEGLRLAKDIRARLKMVSKALTKIEAHCAGQPDRFYQRLTQKVEALLQDREKDTERIHREAALLAERVDITEEIVRMKSHLLLFEKRLNADGEIGRELDFLCQEMNREVNTMTSKAQHFEISTEVVFIKGELEKIREQIQNIE